MEAPHTAHAVNQASSPLELLVQRLDTQAQKSDDPYIQAFSTAACEAVQQDSEFATTVREVLEHRPTLTPQYAANILLRSVQADGIRTDPLYPLGRDRPARWLQEFDAMNQDFDRHADFFVSLRLNVQSNVAERYKAAKLAITYFGSRFDKPPVVLDVGCSQNLGGKKLVLNDQERFAFGEIQVVDRSTGDGSEIVTENDTASRVMNTALRSRVLIDSVIGTDTANAYDPLVQAWAKSNSFYPHEWLNKGLIRNYEALEKATPPNVKFYRGDFLEFDWEKFAHRYPRFRQCDVVIFSAVLYEQGSNAERLRMIETAMQLKPKIIVVMEFANTAAESPDATANPLGLDFYNDWDAKFLFNTFVLDTAELSRGFQKLFTWENGRCQRVVLGPAIGQVGLKEAFKVP
jgi:hypothetical protein